jgi:hypothetical protein
MQRAVFLAVLALTALPTAVAAGGGCHGQKLEETAASCIPGTTWDNATGACVDTPTS